VTPIWTIARHEWRLILKEPRFLLPFLITPLLLIGVQAFALYARMGTVWETLEMARALLLMLAVLAPSSAVPLGADSFAGEKERNTLEILMCLPVRMGALFWGKVLGMLPIPVLVGWIGQGIMTAMLASRGVWLPGFGITVAKAMALTPAFGLFLCALSTLLSLLSDSVRGAAQLTSLAMLALFFATTACSSALFHSASAYSGFAGGLLLASAACFLAARKRFPKVI
jgi:ABC-type Na+ efflux pump permease subunit